MIDIKNSFEKPITISITTSVNEILKFEEAEIIIKLKSGTIIYIFESRFIGWQVKYYKSEKQFSKDTGWAFDGFEEACVNIPYIKELIIKALNINTEDLDRIMVVTKL